MCKLLSSIAILSYTCMCMVLLGYRHKSINLQRKLKLGKDSLSLVGNRTLSGATESEHTKATYAPTTGNYYWYTKQQRRLRMRSRLHESLKVVCVPQLPPISHERRRPVTRNCLWLMWECNLSLFFARDLTSQQRTSTPFPCPSPMNGQTLAATPQC